MDKIIETTGSNLEYLNYIANNAVNTDFTKRKKQADAMNQLGWMMSN